MEAERIIKAIKNWEGYYIRTSDGDEDMVPFISMVYYLRPVIDAEGLSYRFKVKMQFDGAAGYTFKSEKKKNPLDAIEEFGKLLNSHGDLEWEELSPGVVVQVICHNESLYSQKSNF